MQISVLGTGRRIPANCISSANLDQKLGHNGIEAATGMRERYHCVDETQIDLAVDACRAALENASLTPTDIDLIISGSSVPYQPIPSMAPLVMRELNMLDGVAMAFDVNSTCLSFITALDTAAMMINAGRAQRALIFASELASRALPWDEAPEIAALFGDGAAAAVIGTGSGKLEAISMRSFPSIYEACGIGAGGTRFDLTAQASEFLAHSKFSMDGKALFRITSRHFNAFVDDLLKKAGWTKSEVDVVVPHQASPAGLDHMVRHCSFDPGRVVRIVEEYGNQIAASIPFAFDMARRDGRIVSGSKVLFLGTSAGVSFGGAAMVV